MRGPLVLVAVLAGCGGTGLSAPLELYAPAERGDLALSESGRVAVIQRYEVFDPDDHPDPRVEVLRRVGDVRRFGVSHGTAIGRPSDRDALILTGELELEWVVARRRLPLGPALPSGIEWSYRGGSVDHRAGVALLAFAAGSGEAARLELVDVDVRAMRLRGHRSLSVGGPAKGCSLAAAPRAQLFVTCRVPARPGDTVERWIATRFARLEPVWRASVPLRVQGREAGDILSCVSGDGRALVIEHGVRTGGIIEAETTAIVDTASGAVRRFRRDPMRALGRIEVIVPMPGRPAVAEMHTYYPGSREHEIIATSAAFLGISVVDTRSGRIDNVLDTSEDGARHLRHANSSTLAVLPDGTFVLGMNPRRPPAP